VNITVNDDLLGVAGEKVYQLTTTDAGGNVLGVQASGEYAAGTDISDNLINTTNQVQTVTYTFRPRIDDDRNGGIPFCDNGRDTTLTIYVNPTPRVIVTVVRDTICNDTRTEIILTTPSILTSGVVTFDYTSSADAGLTGNSSGLSGLGNGYNISDSLHNATAFPALPLVVRYSITPSAGTTGCANGPMITDSVTVHPTPDTYFINVDSARCYQESNGQATIVAENGVNIFNYMWNDPFNQTTDVVTGLAKGWYTVTVTDNQACTKLDSVEIEEPFRIIPDIDSTRNVSCFGSGDGYVSVDPFGGNGTDYSYIWNIGETTSYIDNLSGGEFSVTVTDHKGCAQDTTVEIVEPGQITPTIDYVNVRCNGESNGSAVVTTPATTYLWSTGATTASVTGLVADTYYVTIIDAGSCYAEGNVTITEPDTLKSENETTKIWCAGDASGTIDITVTGGNDYTDYTYFWFTPDGSGLIPTDDDQIGLSGGNYYVTVTDDRGCQVLDTAIIDEPPVFLSNMDYDSVTCFGDANGWIELDVIGGNGTNYTYTWNSASGTTYPDTSYLDNLLADEYYVTVTDSLNCEIYDTAIVTEPDLLETFISETHSTCYDYSDGTAKLTILGGNGGYSIDWSNGASVDSIFGLTADTYGVTVTDRKGCEATNSVDITEPDEINNNMIAENIRCFGLNNGRIELNPTGGTSPYEYSWSHDGLLTSNLAENLLPGNYRITVLDDNNCQKISNTDITQPDPLIATITKNDISCFGFGDGYISLSMFGGTPEYTYEWSNGYSESTADMLAKGIYNITISDIHDCNIDTTLEIVEPGILAINPDIKLPACSDIRDGFIELNLTGGVEPYYIYWDNGSTEENLYDIRSGIFELQISDNNMCEFDTTFVIRSEQDYCFEIPSAFSPNNDGRNDTWEIELNDLYPYAEIEVFDRRGKRVFYSRGYDESQYWDGKYNGRDLPMDSYHYIIYLHNGTRRISGTVTLLR
jgi:gliding motility-associated-like protein